MKKFFRFALLPIVALMALVACDKEPAQSGNATLTLTSEASAYFAAEGGEGVITYTLEGAIKGAELTATCDAEWVSDITVGETITFVVAANEGDERETKIKVAYGALGFDVNIRQYSEPFIVTVSEIKTTSAYISVEAKDATMCYYFDVIPESDYDEINGDVGYFFEQIVAYYQQAYPGIDITAFLPNLLSTSNDSDAVTGLEPGTTYYAYAVEVDPNTGAAGENVAVKKFTTLEGGDPSKCTFEFEIVKLYSTDVDFAINPSDDSVAYWYAITAFDVYPGDIPMQAEVKSYIEQAAAEYGLSVEDAVSRLVVRGAIQDSWFELEKSTTYYIYAYAMDKQGNAQGPVYKHQFTTKEADISDAEINLVYKVFNGDELYASDNAKFEKCKGKAVLQCEAQPNMSAYYWLMMLAGGDITDTTSFPDDATINAMLENGGGFNKLCTHYYMDWGATATLLGVAADYTMTFGLLHRELVVPSKDNCVTIDNYRENESAEVMGSALNIEPVKRSVAETKSTKLGKSHKSYRAR